MKKYNFLLLFLIFIFTYSCQDGYIDDISTVEPGTDSEKPEVTINYPKNGTEIKVPEETTSIDIEFEAVDDIEIVSVAVSFDGTEIANLNEFLDYRIVKKEVSFDEVTDGEHTITVTATDKVGNTTSSSVTFEKVPPYIPKYRGEALYMPFDGDNIDLISLTYPTEVGSHGYAGEGVEGGDAYAGAEGAYLTFPADNFKGNEFSASFWMKVKGTPDRAGILVAGPPDETNPDSPNNRTKGFRFFREAAGEKQRLKLNIGSGESDTWFDGGENADVAPGTDEWVNFAFTISADYATVYINGQIVKEGSFDGIDWTNVEIISIMSGAPNFTGWNHHSDLSYMDELRMFTVALTQSEVQQIITDAGGSVDPGEGFGEIFYMPFDGDYVESISGSKATEVGTPGFAGAAKGGTDAYAGAEESYLTFPTDGLQNNEFSATCWYKLNAEPDRAGILVMGPPDDENPDAPNNRTSGFRFFREKAGENQRFKLNVGSGEADSWFDGGEAADVDPTVDEWIHLAFTISETQAKVYIDGEVVKEGEFAGVDWTGCDILSIMSGAPRFTGWNHWSDESYMDELRIFDKALTKDEIADIMNADAK